MIDLPQLPTGDECRAAILNLVEETYRLIDEAVAIIHREDAGSPAIHKAVRAVNIAVVDIKRKAFEQTYDLDRLRRLVLQAIEQRDEALRQRDELLDQLTAARKDAVLGKRFRQRRRSPSATLRLPNWPPDFAALVELDSQIRHTR